MDDNPKACLHPDFEVGDRVAYNPDETDPKKIHKVVGSKGGGEWVTFERWDGWEWTGTGIGIEGLKKVNDG